MTNNLNINFNFNNSSMKTQYHERFVQYSWLKFKNLKF